mmetsp:Transcript_1286/g.2321  ORF Transcript_1286/g.2321 Transcript_1286/m.2321 type:complete len:94 (+) Transcript_1286:1193-1474(+)
MNTVNSNQNCLKDNIQIHTCNHLDMLQDPIAQQPSRLGKQQAARRYGTKFNRVCVCSLLRSEQMLLIARSRIFSECKYFIVHHVIRVEETDAP